MMWPTKPTWSGGWTLLIFLLPVAACTNQIAAHTVASESAESLREKAVAAMYRAASFFGTQVARHGGYVYFYSLDLTRRWGEGEATEHQIWVQPPGTPTVGLAYVAAWKATRDPLYLELIEEVAQALMFGQLESGGWTNCIDFDPAGKRVARYRGRRARGLPPIGKNYSSLDDGQTQAAIQFLIQADRVFDFENKEIHQAALTALQSLLSAQYPNGGFPQVWKGPVEPRVPLPASFPSYNWRTDHRIKEYWNLYTLNDDLAGHTAHSLMMAYRIYDSPEYLEALCKLGEFLLLAQLPEPQPAWAQQYNFEMHPAWARKFEPPAIAGHESQAIVELLMDLYEFTGDEQLLSPVPSALEFLERSELPGRLLARYYELQTNRPLYMLRSGDNYSLTYNDERLPGHYSWKIKSRVDDLKRRFNQLRRLPSAKHRRTSDGWETWDDTPHEASTIRPIVNDLDEHGRWVSLGTGERLIGQNRFPVGQAYLSSELFANNLIKLARFVQSPP